MHLTETQLTLPRRTQEPIFIIIGREDDVRRTLRTVEDMTNGDYTLNGSHLDPLRERDYAFVSEPNFKENGIHYTLCVHGQIDENDYLPKCSKNNANSQKKQVSDGY
ncbi:unnamed protein product [Gongylonema pulchrum]|uniref:KH_dom_type_1 domain-containing protein n=1 Tax=Gongylonema pulchrum TaxID=637853 RepID=A0A183D7T3_9BILA|nr:unnamed protein product [Gongylonema pulchrum]